ncbi:MAG: hypothetical protein MJE68_15610, partial [Proteobacteria bacterium]|nr:hypothetical protein [Pseudomonadota bacterium]
SGEDTGEREREKEVRASISYIYYTVCAVCSKSIHCTNRAIVNYTSIMARLAKEPDFTLL